MEEDLSDLPLHAQWYLLDIHGAAARINAYIPATGLPLKSYWPATEHSLVASSPEQADAIDASDILEWIDEQRAPQHPRYVLSENPALELPRWARRAPLPLVALIALQPDAIEWALFVHVGEQRTLYTAGLVSQKVVQLMDTGTMQFTGAETTKAVNQSNKSRDFAELSSSKSAKLKNSLNERYDIRVEKPAYVMDYGVPNRPCVLTQMYSNHGLEKVSQVALRRFVEELAQLIKTKFSPGLQHVYLSGDLTNSNAVHKEFQQRLPHLQLSTGINWLGHMQSGMLHFLENPALVDDTWFTF